LESRIIAVCEAFDAMISSSSYKLAMDVSEAVQELADCAGTQFDPEIAEIFNNLVERGVIQPPTT
jgi:HD-GYP domain-containing protein (c-di-GMP phosphodiesterase class II)